MARQAQRCPGTTLHSDGVDQGFKDRSTDIPIRLLSQLSSPNSAPPTSPSLPCCLLHMATTMLATVMALEASLTVTSARRAFAPIVAVGGTGAVDERKARNHDLERPHVESESMTSMFGQLECHSATQQSRDAQRGLSNKPGRDLCPMLTSCPRTRVPLQTGQGTSPGLSALSAQVSTDRPATQTSRPLRRRRRRRRLPLHPLIPPLLQRQEDHGSRHRT